MKTIIIYYSLDGNCDFIAKEIAKKLPVELLRINTVNQPSSGGLMKYLWGGKQVFMKEKPTLQSFSFNPNDYDLIIFGTPVWAWNFAPALNSFFEQTKISGKKIALFCCHGGQPAKTLEKLASKLAGNQIIDTAEFQEPIKAIDVQAWRPKLNDFISSLTK